MHTACKNHTKIAVTEMTAEEYQRTLQQNLNRLKNADWLLSLVNNLHSAMLKRIFVDGIAGSGGKIGNYSFKPLYAPQRVFTKPGSFLPQGKNSALQLFKNGKLRKTMYLQQGYRQLRQIQGLDAGTVTLTYTGSLQQDFSTGLSVEGGSIILKLNSAVNQDKLTWLKKKYGDSLFQHTQQEKEQFINNATQALLNQLGDCLWAII